MRIPWSCNQICRKPPSLIVPQKRVDISHSRLRWTFWFFCLEKSWHILSRTPQVQSKTKAKKVQHFLILYVTLASLLPHSGFGFRQSLNLDFDWRQQQLKAVFVQFSNHYLRITQMLKKVFDSWNSARPSIMTLFNGARSASNEFIILHRRS